MLSGTREQAEQMRVHAAAVLAQLGLRLAPEKKTQGGPLDEGFDFLGAPRGRTVRVGALEGGLGVMAAA